MLTPCRNCSTTVPLEIWEHSSFVCENCGYHRRISAEKRIQLVVDDDSFSEFDENLLPLNPLDWKISGNSYENLIEQAQQQAEVTESFRYGTALIGGVDIAIGSFDFQFLGGTLGSVAGEKVARTLELAMSNENPAIIFTSSGGARMQEGMISLMQMAKISVSVAALNESRIPLITVICDPTTGGVAASLAFMGDVVLAEPGALAGFAGPRVVLQTIGEEMPARVQTTDRLCHDGFIDQIVPRCELREKLISRLRMFD